MYVNAWLANLHYLSTVHLVFPFHLQLKHCIFIRQCSSMPFLPQCSIEGSPRYLCSQQCLPLKLIKHSCPWLHPLLAKIFDKMKDQPFLFQRRISRLFPITPFSPKETKLRVRHQDSVSRFSYVVHFIQCLFLLCWEPDHNDHTWFFK